MIATLRECPEIGVGFALCSTAIVRLGVDRRGYRWIRLRKGQPH
jgi:hypothetical protein